MKARSVVIQRPERQRPAQRALFVLLTLLAWGLWLSLWLPLITLVAWLVGLHLGYLEVVRRQHGTGGWEEIVVLLGLAAACGTIAGLWSGYNYWRFRHVWRRREGRLVTPREMARSLGVEAATAQRMGNSRRMVLTFADDGMVFAMPGAAPTEAPDRQPR